MKYNSQNMGDGFMIFMSVPATKNDLLLLIWSLTSSFHGDKGRTLMINYDFQTRTFRTNSISWPQETGLVRMVTALDFILHEFRPNLEFQDHLTRFRAYGQFTAASAYKPVEYILPLRFLWAIYGSLQFPCYSYNRTVSFSILHCQSRTCKTMTNPKTLSYLLKKRPPLDQIKQIHARIITSACSSKAFLADSLIHCYLHINNLSSARVLFNQYPLPSPSTLLWNIMIRACSKLQNSSEPMSIFRQMISFDHPSVRILPDEYTFTFVITSCAHRMSVVYGEVVHGMIMKTGYEANLYVGNSLINMYAGFAKIYDAHKVFTEMSARDVFSWTSLVCAYARNGQMNRARQIFWEMPVRNVVSWTVVISGFFASGRYVEALKYFREMLGGDDHKLKPNEAVLVCLLSSCAHLGALDQGNWIHAYIDKNDIFLSSNICTALIDMYAKCGKIDCARRVFDKISQPDVHNFTSFITGLSIHGLGRDALGVFNRMLAKNVKPNEVTILGVLNGCSHSGLVEAGSTIFTTMESILGIVPEIQHYGCYIDLLGRAGYLEKALAVVKSMPMKPDLVIWRALLNACRIHRNADLGEHIINHMKQLEPCGRSGGEVLLSNLYASLGKWESVTEVRKLSRRENHSDIGGSWIEVNGAVHEFRVADKLHPQIVEIRKKLQEVLERASIVGYAGNTSQVSFDLSEEEKGQAVAWHSEKLAIAFGLMSTMAGTSIRIVKNLRTCEDCHSALKAISKVYQREIIVRDRSRFHTFKEGNCSCKDYW